jgi:hypothetical protein
MTVEYLVILTVQKPFGSGFQQSTVVRTRPVDVAKDTATDLYLWAREQLAEHLRDGTVLFFSAEPNALPAPHSTTGHLVPPPRGGAE